MSDYVIDSALIDEIRAMCNIHNAPEAAIRHVWPEAEKMAKDRGTSIEFHVATLVNALWAKAQMEHRQSGKPGNVDFVAYCEALTAKHDPLWKKLIGMKSKAAQAQADVEALEAEIQQTKSALSATESKIASLKHDIATCEADLEANNDEAVEASVLEAAKVWSIRGKTDRNNSIVAAAVNHVVEQAAVSRILHARAVWLRDSLANEEAKADSYRKDLKRLEKSIE